MKKILILSANPLDTRRIRIDEEVREIDEGLRRSKKRKDFKIISQVAVRLRDLRRAMLEYEPQIVHFSGHGDENGIMLEEETGNAVLASAESLAGLFELFQDTVVCVLLNSCYSESQAVSINNHIPYVIGMGHEIPDKAALEFSVGFYDALGAGKTIEEAFRFGRNAIQLYGIPEHLNPVLKKKANRILDQKREQGENVTIDIAIEYVLKFAQSNAQPGNWAGFNRLEAEIGNLKWAVQESYKLGYWGKVLEFRRALGDFLYWRGFWDEAIRIGTWSFAAADHLNDYKEKAWCALYPLTRVYFYQGNYDEAENWSRQSLALFKQQGDDYGVAAACRYLGRALQAKGDLDKAQNLFIEGFDKARQFNVTDSQKNLQGHLLASLASVDYERKQYRDAQRKYGDAMALYKETNDQIGIAEMLHQLGRIALQFEEYEEANQLLENSMKIVEGMDAEQMEAEILYSQAFSAERQGRLDVALEKLTHARERFQNLHVNEGLSRVENLQSRIANSAIHRGP
jgi:tetratricopeptide (TPR) repeat protein